MNENISKTLENINKASDKAAAKFSKAQEKITAFGKGIANAASEIPLLNTALDLIGDPFKLAITAAAALGIGLGVAVDKAGAFQQKTAELSAITGIAGKDLEYLSEQAKIVGIDSGLGAGQAVEAYKLLASNIDIASAGGIKGLQMLQKETILLAQAGQVDLPLAADTMAASINQFGLQASDASRVVNTLAAGAKFGAAEIPDLADALKVAGTGAGIAGVSIENTVGALEVLSQNAIKGGEAGTGLRNVFIKLQTDLGKDISGKGFNLALAELKPKLNDTTYLAKLFGAENINVAQILIKNASAVEEMTDKVTGTQTAMEQAAIQTNTYQGALAQMKAAVDVLFIDAGETLLAPLTAAFSGAADGINWVRNNIELLKGLLVGTAAGVATFGAAWLVTNGFMALTATALIPSIIVGIKAIGLAIVNIPVIGWIAGLVGAVVTLYQTSDKFRATINGIGAVLGSFLPFIKALGEAFMNQFNPSKFAASAAKAVDEFKKIDIGKSFNDAYDKTISDANADRAKKDGPLAGAGLTPGSAGKNQALGKNPKAEKGINAINDGGKQTRIVNVKFDSLVKEIHQHINNGKGDLGELKRQLMEDLVRVIRGSEEAMSQ